MRRLTYVRVWSRVGSHIWRKYPFTHAPHPLKIGQRLTCLSLFAAIWSSHCCRIHAGSFVQSFGGKKQIIEMKIYLLVVEEKWNVQAIKRLLYSGLLHEQRCVWRTRGFYNIAWNQSNIWRGRDVCCDIFIFNDVRWHIVKGIDIIFC